MQKQAIIRALNAIINKKTKVPIAKCVLMSNHRLIATDTETFLSIPYESSISACIPADKFMKAIKTMDQPVFQTTTQNGDDGKTILSIEIADHSWRTTLPGSDPASFPVIYNERPEVPEFLEAGSITADKLVYLKNALDFVINNPTYPHLIGVHLDGHVSATNLYQLYWKEIGKIKTELTIPTKVVRTMLVIGGAWKLYCPSIYQKQTGMQTNYLRIENKWATFENEEGVRISFIPIEGRFPDHRVLIPKSYDAPTAFLEITPLVLRTEIANALKFSNTTNNLGIFSLEGHLTLSTAINETDEGYKVKFDKAKVKTTGPIKFAIDLKQLDLIAAQLPPKEPMEVKFWSPTKPIIINDCYLQLLLNPKK